MALYPQRNWTLANKANMPFLPRFGLTVASMPPLEMRW